jgi:hypothetical protein
MEWWIVGFATSVAGGLLTAASVHLLGRVRAAANWPTAPPVGRAARICARIGTGAGLVLLAIAAALLAAYLTRPVHGLAWLVPAAAAGVVLVAGGLTAAKLVERAELAALIRTPPAEKWIPTQDPKSRPVSTLLGGADPAVPSDGRPGWVYRDAEGGWYLAVAADEPGQRLVRLSDFALVPAGVVAAPLALAGSVEISVYPVQDAQHLSP